MKLLNGCLQSIHSRLFFPWGKKKKKEKQTKLHTSFNISSYPDKNFSICSVTLSLPEFSSQTNEAIKHLVSPFRNVTVHIICYSHWQQSFSKQAGSSSECFCFSKAFLFALLSEDSKPLPSLLFSLILTIRPLNAPIGNKHHKSSTLSYRAEKSHIFD